MAAKIVDARDNFGGETDDAGRPIIGTSTHYAERFLARYAKRAGVTLPATTTVTGTDIAARVDAGRWIAECPDCHDAQYVWMDDPQPLFMCVACFNAAAGGGWRRVTVPANRGAVEAALVKRPLPGNRNWRPGETLAGLRAENVKHGIEA